MNVQSDEKPEDTLSRLGSAWIADLTLFKPRDCHVSRTQVRETFEKHNLEGLISQPKADTVLKRSCREGKKPRGYDTRPLAKPDSDTPLSVGIYRIDPTTGEIGDSFVPVARVRIEEKWDDGAQKRVAMAVARLPEGHAGAPDEVAMKWAHSIADHANELLVYVENSDLGIALRAAAGSLGLAQLLGGGNNFIVPTSVAQNWHDFMRDCASFGVWSERVILGGDAPQNTRIVQDAAKASLEEDLRTLKLKLKDAIDNQSSERSRKATLTARIAFAEQLRAKANLYKNLLSNEVNQIDELVGKFNRHVQSILAGNDVPAVVTAEKWEFAGQEISLEEKQEIPVIIPSAPSQPEAQEAQEAEEDENEKW
jgi:hypothetical protein